MKAIAALMLAGVASLASAQELPVAPGRLVDVGGRTLHLNCTGSGSPTVVLESGASAFSVDWWFVQPEIAKTNRVCSYDRAGYAWSDPGGVETPQSGADDLHALLRAAGERGPYVLVGASFGGAVVRWYQLQHPEDVAGVVFVDSTHEDQLFLGVNGKAMPIWAITVDQVRAMIPPGPIPASPIREPQTGAPFDRLPAEILKLHVQFETKLMNDRQTPTRDAVLAQMEGQVTAFAALHEARAKQDHPLGDLPVVVLTRGKGSRDALKAAHADLAAQSTNSRHTVVPDAGHEIHLFRPDVVIDAIREVVVKSALPATSPQPASHRLLVS
jgi:pimeloyl-ACP methyl ester carboxylesterase